MAQNIDLIAYNTNVINAVLSKANRKLIDVYFGRVGTGSGMSVNSMQFLSNITTSNTGVYLYEDKVLVYVVYVTDDGGYLSLDGTYATGHFLIMDEFGNVDFWDANSVNPYNFHHAGKYRVVRFQ